ncbi:DNA-binding transcriptional LysR family regulator [Herbihabitans rhizosphaerae]|uniref:DNA-binding transcriptional LysR family regulator n=1 Tax=Herbihabitans rhizosphaerae TaxID=1872711 RepID=A0A4Q7L881_9PSEU|nr:LysR family transcriptional regulator [Herbihabitans rhizosphaerae]RZS44861.1 DNA-binding transcriptional LysR family regulator [Herbihabitans rhizosphaerae]
MDLSLLKTFLTVYRAGSVTTASVHLGLSQPAVTAQVKALERELGQQLFERLPRGVSPTTVADELAGQIAEHVDAIAAVAERGLGEHSPFARPVHLAGPAELITTLVVPALAGLVADGLRLRVTLGLADDLLVGLRAGRFDIVLAAIRPRGKGITATRWFDEEFALVAAPSTMDKWGGDPARLRAAPLVAYAEDLPIVRRYWRAVFGTRATASPAVVVPDLRGVLAAVIEGAGVSVLPTYLCRHALESGALVMAHEPDEPPINTLFLATRTGTDRLPHIARVLARLRAAIGVET